LVQGGVEEAALLKNPIVLLEIVSSA